MRTADASSRSCRPSSISSRTACGSTLMPTPSGFSSATLSNTRAGTPIWCRLSASVSPPMPPPAMRTVMIRPRYPACVMARRRGGGQLRRAVCAGAPGWTAADRAVNSPAVPQEDQTCKLYYAPGTCALASHIALEEAGAAYTTERLDFKSNQQNSPEYLKVNPKGRVPALVTDRGVLTETPAMLAYHRAELSASEARAARRRLCVRAGAGLQQLSLLHRARRACPQDARRSLGDRGSLLRRHEARWSRRPSAPASR